MSYLDFDQKFFGRTELLGLLNKRVRGLKEGYRQNVALLGDQYVGKSTLLKYFVANLDEEDIITLYLDLEHKDFGYLYSKLTTSLLYNFCKSKKLPLHEDLDLLLETTKEVLPATVEVVKKIRLDFSAGKVTESYLGLLALPEIFTNETRKFCLLIFDEFQNLEEMVNPQAFQILGNKIMTQKKCLYIVTSSYVKLAKKILSEKLSLLFGNFEVLNVDSFELQTSQEFIEYNLKGIKIGYQLRNFLTDFSGGHPLSLSLISQELIHLTAIHRQTEIFMPIITQAIENTIFDRWGVLSRHFELIINELSQGKGNQSICAVLISLANGNHKLNELMEDLNLKQVRIMQRLGRLIEQGIITKNGSFHYFKDKLFKFWVKFVYQRRLKDLELAPDKQRKQFREEFTRYFENFKLSSRQDLSTRIVELFYCFENESFDFDGRKYKLPTFRELSPLKLKNDNTNSFELIRGLAGDGDWLIVLKKENFSENDVAAVLSESREHSSSQKKCLLIAPTGLDEITRLRALQENFWIWDERELNTLLTLFDKPFILR